MRLDICDGDDWVAVYLDGRLDTQGHSVSMYEWMQLVLMPINSVYWWETDFDDLGEGLISFHDMTPYLLSEIQHQGKKE